MVKADLIAQAMEAAQKAVEALFETLTATLECGDRVVLRRFGVFQPAPRRAGMARNPRTGEPVPIPGGRVARFRPAIGLFPDDR